MEQLTDQERSDIITQLDRIENELSKLRMMKELSIEDYFKAEVCEFWNDDSVIHYGKFDLYNAFRDDRYHCEGVGYFKYIAIAQDQTPKPI